MSVILFFCFKQKTAYEMRISDWSSDVCSSDLSPGLPPWHEPCFSESDRRHPTRRPEVPRCLLPAALLMLMVALPGPLRAGEGPDSREPAWGLCKQATARAEAAQNGRAHF